MEAEKKKILLVDDEPQITRVLKRSLAAHRYDVKIANDAESALEMFPDFLPDLLITDLSMPEMDGLELCRRIRQFSEIPIIVLSVKSEEKTKVAALDVGADDYVTKPFGMDELLARVRAALRRTSGTEEQTTSTIVHGNFEFDIPKRQALVSGNEIHLTPKEFDLLFYLFQNEGKVLTHHNLLGAIWGGNFTGSTEYLRVFVGQLRKKIEPQPDKPRYIVTIPWVGYRFNAESDDAASKSL